MAYFTQNTTYTGVPDGFNNSYALASKFPNPFCDIASAYIPTNLSDALEWMEYLMLTTPPFMAVVNRVVSYFLTNIDIDDASDDVKEKYEKLFDQKLHLIQGLQDIGKDYFCFGGDTEVYTRQGVTKISNLAGMMTDVLGIDGRWHRARFQSYGVQKTSLVKFRNGTSAWVTPEHNWWVCRRYGSPLSKITTQQLKKTHLVPVRFPPRPPRTPEYFEGVMHGLVFATRSRETVKERDMIDAFSKESKIERRPYHLNLPDARKLKIPYLYGFLSGFFAMRGYFQKSCKTFYVSDDSRKVAQTIHDIATRCGIRPGKLSKRRIFKDDVRWYVPFPVRVLSDIDFIRKSVRAKFSELFGRRREYTTIKSIGRKTREEEVFCCVEPETHTFSLNGGIITGNCYGNSFVSLYLPFERYLVCPDCGANYHIKTLDNIYEFDPERGEFKCECKLCKRGKKVFKRVDRRSTDTDKIRIKRWNPKRIELKVHDISGEIAYYYKLDPKFVDHIRKGDPFYLDTTQWGIVKTCLGKASTDGAEYLFRFDSDQIFHMHDSTLAGLNIKGWGIPPMLPYFKLAYYIQLLRRYDEAIALDFIVPFRILYPQGQAPGGQDALTMVSMQTFISAMASMVEKKRLNITSLEVSPFAIGYEMIGGEAKSLSPRENIDSASQELLNSLGFPQELFAGTLSLQAAPVALRLFEREWNPLVDSFNDILQWICNQVSKYFRWDTVTARLTPITLADDLERKGLLMQAAAGQDLSKQTVYRLIGQDYLAEQKRIIKEQQEIQKMQQEAMAQAQAQQANGALGGSGEGGADDSGMNGPGGQVGAVPGDVMEQAKQLAYTLVVQTPPPEVRRQLMQIKQTNPTLHAMVKQEMENLRNQFASQGQQQMIQQAAQGG